MIDQLRSELIKIRTVRSTVVMLLVVVLLSLVPAILICSLVAKDDLLTSVEAERVTIVLIGVQLSQILVAVISALVIAGEFRFGTIRTTFVAEPRRLRVLAAKVITVALLAAIVATVMVVVTSGVGGAIMRARDIDYPITAGDAWRQHWGVVLYSVFYAVIALAIASIVRNAAASIVLVIVIPLIVESITTGILSATNKESWARWLPFSAGSEIATVRTGDPIADHLGPWTGYGYAWLWTAALLALGGWLLQRRDA